MRIAPLGQGIYYVATGLWPVVHLKSFEAVTGKKRDGWLVQTVGGLIAAVGGALLVGSVENKSKAVRMLGITSAAVLAASDIYFVAKGRIPRIYLADAVAEGAVIAAWTLW